jgi:hypothetical protein
MNDYKVNANVVKILIAVVYHIFLGNNEKLKKVATLEPFIIASGTLMRLSRSKQSM